MIRTLVFVPSLPHTNINIHFRDNFKHRVSEFKELTYATHTSASAKGDKARKRSTGSMASSHYFTLRDLE